MRIAIDIRPPITPAMIANTRYIVPMSLWFVEYTKRRHPFGWPWSAWASWAGAWVSMLSLPCRCALRRAGGAPVSNAVPSLLGGNFGLGDGVRAGARELLLGFLEPGRERLLADRADRDRHEG